MSNPHTRWIDASTWICTRHLPSVRMKASVGMCAFSTCDSVRPRRESFDRVATSSVKAQAKQTTATSIEQKKSMSKKTSTPRVEVAQVADGAVEKCAWFKCTKGPNGGPADSRPRSKYCSRACSNSSARYRHKIRAKAKKDD
jgi:hypothetical protein